MSFFLPGVVPINSTFAPVANPSTATLLAELESTNFQVDANTRQQQRIYALSIWAGGSTGGYWSLLPPPSSHRSIHQPRC